MRIEAYRRGDRLLMRPEEAATDVSAVVAEIIADVAKNGDSALLAYAERFDRAKLTTLEVTAQEMDEALASISPALRGAM